MTAPARLMERDVRIALDGAKGNLPANLQDIRFSLEADLFGARPSEETLEVGFFYSDPASDGGPGSEVQWPVMLMAIYTEPEGRGRDNALEIHWWLLATLGRQANVGIGWQVAWLTPRMPEALAGETEVARSWIIEIEGDFWTATA